MDRPRQRRDHAVCASLRGSAARRRTEDRGGCAHRSGRELRIPAGRSASPLRGPGRRRLLRRRPERRRSAARGVSPLPLRVRAPAVEIATRAKALVLYEAEIGGTAAAIAAALDRLPTRYAIPQAEPADDGDFGFLVDHRVALR